MHLMRPIGGLDSGLLSLDVTPSPQSICRLPLGTGPLQANGFSCWHADLIWTRRRRAGHGQPGSRCAWLGEQKLRSWREARCEWRGGGAHADAKHIRQGRSIPGSYQTNAKHPHKVCDDSRAGLNSVAYLCLVRESATQARFPCSVARAIGSRLMRRLALAAEGSSRGGSSLQSEVLLGWAGLYNCVTASCRLLLI
jgi:hypothetical protein